MFRNRTSRTIVLAMVAICLTAGVAAAQLLDATSHPKFVNPLPIPGRIDATTPQSFVMTMEETTQWLGLVDAGNNPLMTTVWGYGQEGQGVTYPGPTFVAMENVPVDVLWKNQLPPYNLNYPGVGGHLLPVDPTLHMAHPAGGGIPTVAHLHGGHTESASDGLPEQWFTQGFAETGPQWVKQLFHYDNDQEAATLWYHDHALGITRLNVYAGLAGFYFLRDARENRLALAGLIPSGPYEIEVVIQDRMFDSSGELFFPSTGAEIEPGFDPLPPAPSAIAEFFGDYIVVNGTVWPKLEVEPRKYRLRYLNGSDSRFYVLELHDANGVAQPFMQIGTDDGLLPRAVGLTRLLLAPGERADLVVDFAGQTELVMRNLGPDEPFKGFNPDGTISDGAGGVAPPADPATTGQIMKFIVNQPLSSVRDAIVRPDLRLRRPIKALEQTGSTRQLVLFEGLDNYGRLQPLLGTLAQGSKAWFEPITENPMLNDVEVWEVYNATEDAHPIHLHLVSFQIISRESFTGGVVERPQQQHGGEFGVGGNLVLDALGGDARLPEPNERGWKDTAVMLPGEVTRVIAKFDREGRYVWHCHILSHEDHEMMRPYQVGPIPAAATAAPSDVALQGETPSRESDGVVLGQNYPNPFNPTTQISFHLPSEASVKLAIYDVSGKEIRTLADRSYGSGDHIVTWDGTDNHGNVVSTGIYFYRLNTGSETHVRKMVMVQ